MKIKLFISFLVLSTIILSCNKNSSSSDNFDHEGQALIDDVTLSEYLETHYYIPPTTSEAFGVIDTIENGETPLTDLVETLNVEYANIDYKLYVLKNQPEGVNDNPTKVDRIFVKYQGHTIENESVQFDENILYSWLSLQGTIPGWGFGFPEFKSGNNITQPNMPHTYENTGKGVIFMPSGLAYRNLGSGLIGANEPLYFHIDLAEVQFVDDDSDSILSKFEDVDGNNIFTDDDTDNDGLANYTDSDDDGDGILTKYENPDPNDDGNPNDAIDTDGDNTPDYLDTDDDNDGVKTLYENADSNGDGNPDDAQDSDGDEIPDYLDNN